MLESIGSRGFYSPFILFIDSTDNSGTSLFLSIVKSFIESSDLQTHVFCWERKSLRFLQGCRAENQSKVHIHDCVADFQGWIHPENKSAGFLDGIRKSLASEECKINIVLDSLSLPMFTFGFGPCLQELHEMVNNCVPGGPQVHQLLCLVHKDVLPWGSSSLSHLKHIAHTSIELSNQVAHIIHRKSGGHVKKTEEKYQVLPDGSFKTASLSLDKVQSVTKPATLPQNVASFRVNLSEKEKEDRNQLVLPYMRSLNQSQEAEGGGKVIYEPDSVDDWDDEDPDDDLDI